MAWGAKVDMTQLTSVSSTEQYFTTFILLNPGELSHLECELDPVGTPTDDMIINLYGTLDDGSENWDDKPFMSFTIPNSPDPCKKSVIVSGVYRFRVGAAASGATDTHTSVDCSYRLDGVSA